MAGNWIAVGCDVWFGCYRFGARLCAVRLRSSKWILCVPPSADSDAYSLSSLLSVSPCATVTSDNAASHLIFGARLRSAFSKLLQRTGCRDYNVANRRCGIEHGLIARSAEAPIPSKTNLRSATKQHLFPARAHFIGGGDQKDSANE